MSETTTQDQAELTVPLEDAAREIQNQLKIAAAIKAQRIRNRWELDHARTEKQEWVGRTTELLIHLFGNSAVADECNDWVATILPEYAELDLFIELFNNEMKHRMERLRSVGKRLTQCVQAAHTLAPVADPETHPDKTLRQDPQPLPDAAVPAPAAPSPAAPAVQAVGGALFVRAADDQAGAKVAEFLSALGLSPHVINRRESIDPALVNELCDGTRVSIILCGDSTTDPAQSARQMFDLGCCVGRVGIARVCVLSRVTDQASSDPFGIPHIPIDPTDAWHLHLARHLRRGGFEIDLNKLA